MKKIVRLIIIAMIVVAGTGCKKCVESHKEQSRCVRYTYIKVGKVTVIQPHYYSCKKTVCDRYEE